MSLIFSLFSAISAMSSLMSSKEFRMLWKSEFFNFSTNTFVIVLYSSTLSLLKYKSVSPIIVPHLKIFDEVVFRMLPFKMKNTSSGLEFFLSMIEFAGNLRYSNFSKQFK